MMLDLAHFCAGRQQLVEMAAPSRGVLALAIATRRCPIEHGFNSPSQPSGRFRLLRPKRLNDLHHEGCVDALDRQGPHDRLGIGLDRGAPLRGVLGVTPAGTMGGDILFRALLERQSFGDIERDLGALHPACFDRVYALVGKPPALGCPGPSLSQAKCRK